MGDMSTGETWRTLGEAETQELATRAGSIAAAQEPTVN